MYVEHLSDPRQFAPAALRFLIRHEAENNLMIGLFENLSHGRREGSGQPVLYMVRDDQDEITAAALWAGFMLILTRGTPESHVSLADHLANNGTRYPRACGPAPAVAAFALADFNRTSRPHAPGSAMRLMQTRQIKPPPKPAAGHARYATSADADNAIEWAAAFVAELNLEAGDRSTRVRRDIERENVLLWRDPNPVCMALAVGRTPDGARIGSVYTPPELRRRGYASACVAELGRRLLERGGKFVYLYAEATNKTSNHIYESIGFEPVCEWQEFDLNPAKS